jgi:asparagine synthase (glutamine-hydrolysing)
MRLLALISGGKDSWYSYYVMFQRGIAIPVVVTFIPKNPESYMLQHPMVDKAPEQIRNMKNPPKHYVFEVSGRKEEEIEEMKKHLERIVKKEKIEGIISGAILSEYQKQRIDFICEKLGIISYAPLWHKSQDALMREIVLEAGFEFLIADTCAEGIEKWKGQKITVNTFEDFIKSLKKAQANISGEGGEYETFVTKTPFFEIQDI